MTLHHHQVPHLHKKLIGKSSWYKKRAADEETKTQGRGQCVEKTKKGVVDDLLKTRAVLFVEQTPQGELAKKMKEQLQGLEATLGFRIRVVERTGRSLKNIFSQNQVSGGLECGRGACITCSQDGEEKPPCTLASVVYESVCKQCNPGYSKKGDVEYGGGGEHPSLYV